MKRARECVESPPTAELLLQRAMAARTPSLRAKYAKRGLALHAPIDKVTQSMLLRQLYLSSLEQRDFERCELYARQMIELGEMLDVCRHDLARVYWCVGDTNQAAGELRLAARSAPASRRSFHLWTLASVLFLAKRYDLAFSAIERAARWSTSDRPLILGIRTLICVEAKLPHDALGEIIEQLESAPCGRGYGRFVLGMLCFYAGRVEDAERYLRAFVERTCAQRPALAIALAAELDVAQKHLSELRTH